MPVRFQLRMLQLVVGNGRHVIKLTSNGSVALYAPSSVLLMVKAVQCVHARRVCALQSSSFQRVLNVEWTGHRVLVYSNHQQLTSSIVNSG